VMSPWGKRSGGHFNPAITFTFYRLGKVEFWDAWFYVIAQFVGALSGVALARYVLRGALANHAVRYAVTVPGMYGSSVAFVAVHRVFCRHTDCELLHIRSTAVRHEHEPGTNIRLSTSRELLACALDLFHSSVDGHAGRRRGISSSPPGRRPILR
jgi:glycerol uptake facilitator-like aquaporin